MRHQAFKYELKPNNKQRTLLQQAAGTARFAWNWGLAQQFKALNNSTKFPNAIQLHKILNQCKQDELTWMRSQSKWIPQEAIRSLDVAWKNKREGRAKAPKFKKRGKCRDSFRLGAPLHVKGKTVQLPRFGQLRVKESTDKLKGRILSATVSRSADRWFVSFTVERNRPKPKPPKGKPIGLDFGLKKFITAQTGKTISAPKPLKINLRKLRKLNRQLSRKQQGSKNQYKAKIKLVRFHRKIHNQRIDFLHKLSTKLAKTKSIICVEDLCLKGMIKSKRFSRSLTDLGWGEFIRQLGYKTGWYGSELRKIDRWCPSSKTCCLCGYQLKELPLWIREWECPKCHWILDRDQNAAINILLEGLTLKELKTFYPEFLGKSRLWRSSKPPSRRSKDRRSRKQISC